MSLTFPGKSVFKPKKPKLPPAPKVDTEQIDDTAGDLQKRLAKRKGRAGTIATSPLGVTGDDAQIARPTLLGG